MADQASAENKVNTGKPWNRSEVDATVADYFQMLRLELFGQKFNKSLHRRELQKKLDGRSEGSIEMKHQNISAVLMELGTMPLAGYKGLPNYQQLLVESVAARLILDEALDRAALSAVELPAELPSLFSFDSFVTERPDPKPYRVGDERIEWIKKAPIKRDYLAREAQNRALGLAGEQLVLEYEIRRLHALGNRALADRVEHVAKTQGDGCGYAQPERIHRALAHRLAAFQDDRPQPHLRQYQSRKQPARPGTDHDGAHCRFPRCMGDECVGRVGRRHDLAAFSRCGPVCRGPVEGRPQNFRPPRRLHIHRIDQYDRPTLARIVAAFGDGVADQLVDMDAELHGDRPRQRAVAVIQWELDVGKAKHAWRPEGRHSAPKKDELTARH